MIQFRSGAQGYGYDLQDKLKKILYDNGMNANIRQDASGNNYLVVRTADMVAEKSYKLNHEQLNQLTALGGGPLIEKAYNQLVDIVRKDFSVPPTFTNAQSAGVRDVVTGIHGYRNPLREREWMMGENPYRPLFATPPYMRSVEPSFVRERKDGRMMPGELQSGAYGFRYKGDNIVMTTPLKQTQNQSVLPAPRPEGMAKPLSKTVNTNSPMYFDKNSFLEVLKTHGIILDQAKKTLTIQSSETRRDVTYDLHDDEIKKITASRLVSNGKEKGYSIDNRLNVINNIIKKDFDGKVTKEQLESRNLINIKLKPEVKAVVEKDFIEQDRRNEAIREQKTWDNTIRVAREKEIQRLEKESKRINEDNNAVNGRDIGRLITGMGFFTAAAHGREVVIGEIRADKKQDGSYVMKAMINGEWSKEHSLTANQYALFLAHDDKTRLKDFERVFSKEIAIRKADPRELYQDVIVVDGKNIMTTEEVKIAHSKEQSVDGRDLGNINSHKGFYVDVNNGREVDVQKINVERIREGSYKMTAVIGGRTEKLEATISEKDFNKFLAQDDYHRMKMFAKLFPEADIKTRPEYKTNIGEKILAALTVARDVVMNSPMGRRQIPEVYENRSMHEDVTFSKAGSMSPEMAAANYENLAREEPSQEQTKGIGMGV